MKNLQVILLAILLWLCQPSSLSAAIFLVYNPSQFQAALNAAAMNSEDNEIRVYGGLTYHIASELSYTAEGTRTLHIKGVLGGKKFPVLDGGGASRILAITRGGSASDSHIWIENLTFQNGRALTGAGLYIGVEEDYITITNCRFLNNIADDRGGGCYMSAARRISLTNNIFSGNESDYEGGGLYIENRSPESQLQFHNNTILGNKAYGTATGGGGVYINSFEGAKQYLLNNIIRDNHANVGKDFFIMQWHPFCYSTVSYNNFSHYRQDGMGGFFQYQNIDLNPRLTADFHLTPGSPCIDTGSNAASTVTHDFEGEPRMMDGNRDGIVLTDMGADEFNPDLWPRGLPFLSLLLLGD